jgi:hypothetical protein
LALSDAGVQQDRLAELQRAKSTDKERARLKKNLLNVTGQRTDIAQQYAVRTLSAQMALAADSA